MNRFFIKNQKIPTGTEICPVLTNSTAAEWVRAADTQTDNAILYLHGGGFVMGSPATHRELAARLSASTKAAVLVLDYRLAPEHPFPAAMRDAISAYQWLLKEGYTGKRLAIGGPVGGHVGERHARYPVTDADGHCSSS
jgi:acetyl esterase/lipase